VEYETDNWNTQKPRQEAGQKYQARDAQALFIRREDQGRSGRPSCEDSIAEMCCREGISQGIYYKWSKDFMEAGIEMRPDWKASALTN
jgi:hypothetical protein